MLVERVRKTANERNGGVPVTEESLCFRTCLHVVFSVKESLSPMKEELW